MIKILRIFSATSLLALLATFAGAQVTAKPDTPKVASLVRQAIKIETEIGKVTTVSAADIAKLNRLTVKTSDHGTETTFEGVALVDVLKLAGVEFGESMRGKRLASYVVVEAADKYRVVYAIAELDPGFTDKVVILADTRDGKPLPENAKDWQVVAPDEKRSGRWVRQVIGFKIVSAP